MSELVEDGSMHMSDVLSGAWLQQPATQFESLAVRKRMWGCVTLSKVSGISSVRRGLHTALYIVSERFFEDVWGLIAVSG